MKRRLRSLLWRVPVEQEVHEELAHHREERVRELIDRGWTPDAARAEADRRLAGVELTLTRLGASRNRRWDWHDWWQELAQDVRFALRQCRLQPGFTAAAVLTLALGSGATTAIFSVVHAVVLKPFPFPDPNRVLWVYTTWQEGRSDTSAGNYEYIRQRISSLEHLAAASYSSFNLAGDDAPERVLGMRVTWNYFPVFGIPPLHGRTFRADEDQPGREHVVVLSHRFWERRFGADPGIVGRQIRLSGQPHDVIGVMPPSFDEILGNEQLWVPAAFTPERRTTYDEHYLWLYGLRRADVTLAQVNDDLARAAEGLRRDHPEFNLDRGAGAEVFGELLTSSSSTRLGVLLGAVVLVLLIACGNVANLFLAKLAGRSRELAVRAAVGAGRGRIVRQVLTESLVVSSLGGLAGLLLAWWALPLLVAGAPRMQRIETAALNAPVLAMSLALVVATAVLVGLLPAWLATRRRDLRSELGDGRGAAGGGVRPWVRQTLVGVQTALVLTVLAGAALLVRSAVNLQQVPLGFDPSGALVGRVGFIGESYREPERVKAAFLDLADRLESAPGVALAALDSQPPLVGGGGSNGLIPEGRPLAMASIINSQSHFITPDYFRLLGIPLRAGRHFTADDVRAAPPVMIVNETLARQAFGDENPVGKRITCCEGSPDDPHWKAVVGVVADVRTRGPAFEPRPEFYLPVAQIPDAAWSWVQNTLIVIVRPETGPPEAMAPVIRNAVREIDPALPVYGIGTFDEALRLSMLTTRFNTQLMSLLGLTGLLLAALGIYSVLAWLVAQRTREIGVRMALGAPAATMVRQVALHGLAPVVAGLALGTAGAMATGRVLESQLFQVGTFDPVSIGVVLLLMLVVAAAAVIVPARRAARIDPATALHEG
jgi:putative ABC transport system permease protein